MKLGQICREEMKPIINIIISVLAGMLLITTIWKNDYTQDIPFGILNQDNSALAESIVQQFQVNPTLDVSYYADSETDLKQAILDNKIEAGVMIPRDFGKNVTLQKSPQAIIFADCSNIITGGGAMGAASTVLGTLSAGVKMQTLEGSSFVPVSAESSLGTFSYVERVLYEPQGDYIRKMSYLLAATICMQIFFMSYYIPLLLRKRKELAEAKKEDWKGIIKDGVARALVVGAGCVLAQIISLLVIAMYKNLPMRGTL